MLRNLLFSNKNPSDIKKYIFQYSDIDSLVSTKQVSKEINSLINHGQLWKKANESISGTKKIAQLHEEKMIEVLNDKETALLNRKILKEKSLKLAKLYEKKAYSDESFYSSINWFFNKPKETNSNIMRDEIFKNMETSFALAIIQEAQKNFNHFLDITYDLISIDNPDLLSAYVAKYVDLVDFTDLFDFGADHRAIHTYLKAASAVKEEDLVRFHEHLDNGFLQETEIDENWKAILGILVMHGLDVDKVRKYFPNHYQNNEEFYQQKVKLQNESAIAINQKIKRYL